MFVCGHLHAQSLGFLRKRDGTGITFEGAVTDCDICAGGEAQQLAHPKTANHKINQHFQLSYGDLMIPITSARESAGTPMWTPVYLLTSKNEALQSLQLFVGSTVIPFHGRIVRWRADKARAASIPGRSFSSTAMKPVSTTWLWRNVSSRVRCQSYDKLDLKTDTDTPDAAHQLDVKV